MLPLEWLVLRRLRRRLYPDLRGRILELGVGTGVNLPLYDASADLVAIDLSAGMLQEARRRPTHVSIRWVQADAERLPFSDGVFERVAVALLLCSVNDPAVALAEMRRVLQPGGQIVLLEHVRGQRWVTRWLTDRLAEPWHRFSRSCHLDRETARLVYEAGFEPLHTTQHLFGLFQTIVARNPSTGKG